MPNSLHEEVPRARGGKCTVVALLEESYRDHTLWIQQLDGPRVLAISIALMDKGAVSDTVFTGYVSDHDGDDVVEWYKPGPWCAHFTHVAARSVAVLQDRCGGLDGGA